MTDTLSLFPDLVPARAEPDLPGLRYADAVVSPEAQADLIARASTLAFAPFDFRGFKGHRRTVSFGSRYDFSQNRLDLADPFPDWLADLRASAARFAALPEGDLVQAMITEYAPGAGIGWHRDRPEYGQVVGLSFGSACVLCFRRPEDGGWRRLSRRLLPGSAYLLDGPARHAWQHSIAPGEHLRYSVTFRTLDRRRAPGADGTPRRPCAACMIGPVDEAPTVGPRQAPASPSLNGSAPRAAHSIGKIRTWS